MKTILLLRGLPASGKSTYAKKLIADNPGMYKRINRDDMRQMLDNYQLNKSNEKFVRKMRDWLILEALRDGKHVIVDDTNLSPKNFTRIQQLADTYKKESGHEVQVKIKEFEIDLQEAIARDAQRARPVGRKVILQMYQQFYAAKTEDDKTGRGPHYIAQDQSLPTAIICDLDGTLAIIHHRNPFDASTCEADLLNEPIAEIVKTYYDKGDQIILLSGRTDDYKAETERWLVKYDIPYHQLIMRKSGDSRKDAVIKKEIVEQHIKNKFNIRFVLDDRDQVVDMWRLEIGYACLQVNYGNF